MDGSYSDFESRIGFINKCIKGFGTQLEQGQISAKDKSIQGIFKSIENFIQELPSTAPLHQYERDQLSIKLQNLRSRVEEAASEEIVPSKNLKTPSGEQAPAEVKKGFLERSALREKWDSQFSLAKKQIDTLMTVLPSGRIKSSDDVQKAIETIRKETYSLKRQIEDLQSKAPGRTQKNKAQDLRKELHDIIHTANELKSRFNLQITSREKKPLSREEWDSKFDSLNEELDILGKEFLGKRSMDAYKNINNKLQEIHDKIDNLTSQALDKTQKMNAKDLNGKVNDIQEALDIRYIKFREK